MKVKKSTLLIFFLLFAMYALLLISWNIIQNHLTKKQLINNNPNWSIEQIQGLVNSSHD